MYIKFYINDEEHEHVKKQGKGYVRRLVQLAMGEWVVNTVEMSIDEVKALGKKSRKGTPLQKGQNPNNFCKKCGSVLPYFKGKCKNCG